MKTELKMLPVKSICVDEKYQRDLNMQRIKRMKSAFDQGASKAISVSMRCDGSFWVYDGQHTLELFKILGLEFIPAVVVQGDAKKEAGWFSLMNGAGASKANPGDKQKAEFFSGNELAVKAKHLLDLYEIEIAKGGTGAHKTRAIDYIKVCLKSDEPRLIRAMDMIDELWREEKEAWSRAIMRGAYEVAGLDYQDKVQAALEKRKITPRRVLDVARGMQEATGEPGSGMGVHEARNAVIGANVMSRKRCIRRHYNTAPGFDPIKHAILGAAVTDKESSDKLLLRELASLESITHGTGSEQDWRDLVDVVNLCAEAMRMGIGQEAMPACSQAKDALIDAAHRYKATGRMGLTGAGIQAIRDTIEYHDLQRRSIARSKYEQIIKKTADRVRSNRPHGVSA